MNISKFKTSILLKSGLIILIMTFSFGILMLFTDQILIKWTFIFCVGLSCGWLLHKFINRKIYFNNLLRKNIKTIDSIEKLVFNKLRKLYFKFTTSSNSKSFLLNISFNQRNIIQVLHRLHFPEICSGESDNIFGLAIYIPLNNLAVEERLILDNVIYGKAIPIIKDEVDCYSYYIIDVKSNIKYGGELIINILKKAFGIVNHDSIVIQIFDEGSSASWDLPQKTIGDI